MGEYTAIAEGQYGALSREQARGCGLTDGQVDRLVKAGRLCVLFPSVYGVAGSPRTRRQRAMAACLWLGEDAGVSHITAGSLLRLDSCRTVELHLSVLRAVRCRSGEGVIVHRVLSLPRSDLVVVDGIPCTSATRTLLDIAAMVDDETLEVAFESARRMGLTSVSALERRMLELGTRAGVRGLRRLLAHQRDGDPALQFRLEVKTARLLRQSALPVPDRQYAVGAYRIDFAFPHVRVGVECEGFEYHGSRLAWKRDKRRAAWLERQGWRLLYVTWSDVVDRPGEVIERIALALGLRAA